MPVTHQTQYDVIFAYTRAQALADGELVDAGPMAREAGFRYPVALTRAAWQTCVALSPAAERVCNDERGRLWDVLVVASFAGRSAPPDAGAIAFSVACVTTGMRPTTVQLHAVCGPGDDGEPVVTIMLPGED